jgi:hypothetical protein
MSAAWEGRLACRKCHAALRAAADPGSTDAPTLAVFYCPACGERNQVDLPAGADPLSVVATVDAG